MRAPIASLLVAMAVVGCGSAKAPGQTDLAMATTDLAAPADLQAMVPGGPALQPIVHPSHGIFELSWTNPVAGCSMIAIDRRLNGGSYTTVHTVGGSETSYTDVDHDDSGTFCYQLQCQPGAGGDALPSNQQCVAQ